MNYSQIHMRMLPEQVHAFDMAEAIAKGKDCTVGFMHDLGVTFDEADEGVVEMTKIAEQVFAGDAAEAQTGSSIAAGIQFLRYFAPKAVKVITEKRTIDDMVPRTVAGEWHDEEIVQPVVEELGQLALYSDESDFPLAGFKPSYIKRTIVRFEAGLQTGKLEEMRVAAMKMRVSAQDVKRSAVALVFAQGVNDVGFNGFNNGENGTWGILNEIGLGAYKSVAQGASGSGLWANKTFKEIVKDLNTAAAALRKQSGSNFDANNTPFTLAIAADCVDYLNTVNELGNKSVAEWISGTWKKCRVVSIPQLSGANGGANCFYMLMQSLGGNTVCDNYVAATMRLLGTERRAKGIREDYTNAVAGVLVAQPTGIVRYSGI